MYVKYVKCVVLVLSFIKKNQILVKYLLYSFEKYRHATFITINYIKFRNAEIKWIHVKYDVITRQTTYITFHGILLN